MGTGGTPGFMEAQDEAKEALALAVAARVPVLLWGSPGTGKTSAIRAMADASGWPCETVIASIREPSDFAGLPSIADGRLRFVPPLWAERLADEGHGLLFLDELSTAPPAVQAALLRVVLERVVGDLALPARVVVVAAANPPDETSDAWELSPPLANRFCHLDWPVDRGGFAKAFSSSWYVPAIPSLPRGWEERIPAARSFLARFLTVRPALALQVPDDASTAGRAWPSPRTWDMAARLLAACDATGADPEVRATLLVGAVGEGVGFELLAWMEELDLPRPDDVLADPHGFTVPARADRVHAVLSSMVEAVAAEPTIDRWHNAWTAILRVSDTAPDVAAVAARSLAACRPDGAAAPDGIDAFADVLRDAGLFRSGG